MTTRGAGRLQKKRPQIAREDQAVRHSAWTYHVRRQLRFDLLALDVEIDEAVLVAEVDRVVDASLAIMESAREALERKGVDYKVLFAFQERWIARWATECLHAWGLEPNRKEG
jgi:hypothetical protein